ncbi:alternative ribosome rescue aminoacyl-tRNA hydrolase ArfB [Halioxenophilus aromaticivorans]|uniref:Alternative ribosome rescue aminoacyl-tRNA hydrolase ArfB n=1 Tax=Halioxenophilus aromaticivorans TaxID=1306992 RepID=A0AAV3TYP0_9ALTE
MDEFAQGIFISPGVRVPLEEIDFSAIRAQGSGGQNVNKVSSAIHLRFNIVASSLPEEVKEKLLSVSDQRLTNAGEFVLKSQEHRTQEQNRYAALVRFQQWLQDATKTQKKRKATRPTRASKERRLQKKTQRSTVKSNRGKVSW